MKGEATGEREQDKVIDAVADAEEVTARGKGLTGCGKTPERLLFAEFLAADAG
jgi:hypothetical protein